MTFRRQLAARVAAGIALVLLSAAPATLSAKAAAPNVAASNYDVTIDLRPDGSLDVVERITIRVGNTPITWFERNVPDRRTDGLTNVVAMIDGQVAPPLKDGIGVRLRNRSGIDARWQFEPTSNRSRTFELRYHASHVLAPELAGPHLMWTALPAAHAYPIDAARVTLRAPAGTLAVSVSATGGDIHPATSWQDGLVVARDALAANSTIALDVVFSSGTITPVDPEWVARADQARKLMPAFISAGISLIAIGFGTLVMIRIRIARSVDLGDAANWPADADDAAPAIAATLLNRGQSAGWLALQAAFFRLVRDGRIVIEKAGDGNRLGRPAFTVKLGTGNASTAHERWLVDAIAAQGSAANLRRVTKKLARRPTGFRAALKADMMAARLLDADRVTTSSGLVTAGVVLFGMTLLATMLLAGLFIADLGPALLAVPGGVFVDAVAFIIAGRALSNLSEEGERRAARWRARVAELRQIMRAGGAGHSLAEFERWLPIAIGAGFGGRWVNTFDRELRDGGANIAWVRAMGSPDDAQASIAMIIAISGASSAGSSAGVAAGGGGAGGGSSAAG